MTGRIAPGLFLVAVRGHEIPDPLQPAFSEARALDVWKRVEGALRPRTTHAGNAVDAVDDQVAAMLEYPDHALHGVRRLWRRQRLDGSHLREAGRTRRRIDHQLVELGGQRPGGDRVAQPP